MRLTTEEVRHLAVLARVGMSCEDVETMRDQMTNILYHFEVLKDVDTDHVEPTAHSADVQTVMREDEARPSRDRENMLTNAPHREADFLRVRSVLD